MWRVMFGGVGKTRSYTVNTQPIFMKLTPMGLEMARESNALISTGFVQFFLMHDFIIEWWWPGCVCCVLFPPIIR
jgi:hypothetical protein